MADLLSTIDKWWRHRSEADQLSI